MARTQPVTREDFHNKIRCLSDVVTRLKAENVSLVDQRSRLLVWLKSENPKLYKKALMELAFPKEE